MRTCARQAHVLRCAAAPLHTRAAPAAARPTSHRPSSAYQVGAWIKIKSCFFFSGFISRPLGPSGEGLLRYSDPMDEAGGGRVLEDFTQELAAIDREAVMKMMLAGKP